MNLSLEGKVAIVTGGSRGIGRAIAQEFARAGASLALAARGDEGLARTAKELEGEGDRIVTIPTDVSDPTQCQTLVDRTVEEMGTVDILVNNAGAAPFMSSFDQTRLEGYEKYFRVNFLSAVYCTKAVAPVLLGKQAGCVLNVASVAGFIATPGESYYGDAKAALIHFTKTIAREWAGSNIRVNAIAPGWVDTPMNEVLRNMPETNQAIVDSIAMRRWGRPEEIAGPALFLCSSAASFITGSVLIVDGGQTASALMGL